MKKALCFILLSVFVISLTACGPKLYQINLVYDATLGTIQGVDRDKFKRGETLSWEAVSNDQIIFSGWYIDQEFYTDQTLLTYTVEKSCDIEAKFEYPTYTLAIQSVKFYASYDNPNSDQMFELKVANLFLSMRKIEDLDYAPELEWIDLELTEENWVVVSDEQHVLLYTFEPMQTIFYENSRAINDISIVFRYTYGFHIQFSTGQHVSSSIGSGSTFTIQLEPKDAWSEIQIPLFNDSYASIYMDITYRYSTENISHI